MTNKLSDETARELVGLAQGLLQCCVSHYSGYYGSGFYLKDKEIIKKAKAELEKETN